MPRDFYIGGETLATVWFGNHVDTFDLQNSSYGNFYTSGTARLGDLGLAVDQIDHGGRFRYKYLTPDDYGDTPAEVIVMPAEATVHTRLIHVNTAVLNAVLTCSQGGAAYPNANGQYAHVPLPGYLLGNNLPLLASGNYFMRLSLFSQQRGPTGAGVQTNYKEVRFPAVFLDEEPFRWPLGTEASIVDIKWRAVPYTPMNLSGDVSALSSGVYTWQYNPTN
jgi:hypothetical protein